ncbi:response regulator [Singulisphaera sp. PoT]|uniref:response regulator n=1 Tax=Singulisphaera sp. PoT TaxID=3411797 RepID=UPI003BF60DE9
MTLTLAPSFAAQSRTQQPYVLIVDDHISSLKRMSQIIERAGHACETAESASQAVAICDRRRPQVVVTDLAMPNLDGCGLASWLGARYPSIPLLLMTGQMLDARELVDLRRRFTAVFPKPVDVDWFLECLDRLMPAHGFSSRP